MDVGLFYRWDEPRLRWCVKKYFHLRPVAIRQNKYGSDLHDTRKMTCKVRRWILTASLPIPVAFLSQAIGTMGGHLRSSWTVSQLEKQNVNVNVLHVYVQSFELCLRSALRQLWASPSVFLSNLCPVCLCATYLSRVLPQSALSWVTQSSAGHLNSWMWLWGKFYLSVYFHPGTWRGCGTLQEGRTLLQLIFCCWNHFLLSYLWSVGAIARSPFPPFVPFLCLLWSAMKSFQSK